MSSKFELRNKKYNFCTNILRTDNKEEFWYERDICQLLNMSSIRIQTLEKEQRVLQTHSKLLKEKVAELEKKNETLNNTIEYLQSELFKKLEEEGGD